jgi:hypothetical protein
MTASSMVLPTISPLALTYDMLPGAAIPPLDDQVLRS